MPSVSVPQKVGAHWLVAVNSSSANRGVIDASGAVGPEQLGRLETLLNRLSPEPRILVTHYPICLALGQPEKRLHGLRDLPQVLDVVRNRGICLWLHGHRHHAYQSRHPPQANFPVICSGSATQHCRASTVSMTSKAIYSAGGGASSIASDRFSRKPSSSNSNCLSDSEKLASVESLSPTSRPQQIKFAFDGRLVGLTPRRLPLG